MKKNKYKSAKEALENQDIVIFRAGKYPAHGVEYSEKDIDNIIENTDLEKVGVVMHHPKNTTYSLANFERLTRVGKDLVGRFKNFNSKFAESIKSGLFPERSVRFSADNKLEHLGFLPLGVNAGVKDMPTIQFEENKDFNFTISNEDIEFNDNKKEGFTMDKELKDALAKLAKLDLKIEVLEKENKDFEEANSELEKLKKEIEVLRAENKKLKEDATKNKTSAFSAIITKKLEEVKTDEDKKKVKEKLEKQSKNFEDVKDFSEMIEMMKFDTTVKADTGESEDFESNESDSKKLAKDFEALISDAEKAEKFEKEKPKQFEAMQNAFYNV